jgi:hypothetical protein
MYRIDLENLVRNKLYICKEYHIQPSEIDRMMYFDYETMLEEIKQIQTNQEKENEKQQEEYDKMQSSMNPASMMRNMQMPKMQMPSFSMPKF